MASGNRNLINRAQDSQSSKHIKNIGVINDGKKVAGFVGCFRTASWNSKVAQELITLAPHSLQAENVKSCPYGKYVWDGKPGAVVYVAQGTLSDKSISEFL